MNQFWFFEKKSTELDMLLDWPKKMYVLAFSCSFSNIHIDRRNQWKGKDLRQLAIMIIINSQSKILNFFDLYLKIEFRYKIEKMMLIAPFWWLHEIRMYKLQGPTFIKNLIKASVTKYWYIKDSHCGIIYNRKILKNYPNNEKCSVNGDNHMPV